MPVHAMQLPVLLVTLLAAAAPAQDPRREVHDYLAKSGFTPDEAARLEAGEVVARATTVSKDGEIVTIGAVKIRAPRDRVLGYYGQMISYVDGAVTLAFSKFSTPPSIGDVKSLVLDRADVDELRSCKPGNCGWRLGGTGISSLQSAIDWNSADHAQRLNEFVRQAAVSYAASYMARGDAALVTYDDRGTPVSLRDQWRGIIANTAHFHEYAPELKAYLEAYPGGSLQGARDVIYWAKEDYGLKPVVSIVHGVIYQPPSRTDRAFVVQKQIYANHYFDGSLAVATLLSTTANGAPATYLVYANRSRGDLLQGGFGGLKRNMAQAQAKKAAEATLGTIKQQLEK